MIKTSGKNISQYAFALLMISMYILLICIYVLKIELPISVILPIVTLASLVGDRNHILTIAICCIPLATSIQYSYVLMICMGIYLFKFHKDIRINKNNVFILICMLILFAVEITHWSNVPYIVIDSVRVLVPILFMVVITCIDLKKINYVFMIRILALTTIVICCILMYNLLSKVGYNILSVFQGKYRFGYAYGSTGILDATFNPNSLGVITLIPLVGLLQITQYEKKQHVLDYVFMALLFFFGVLTLSRTYFVCLAISIMLYIVDEQVDTRRILKFAIVTLCIGFVVIFVLNMFFDNTFEALINRFAQEDISNGRIKIFKQYTDFITSDFAVLIRGTGVLDMQKVAHKYGIYTVPHNGLQEVWVSSGVIGLIAMCLMFVLMFFSAKKKNTEYRVLNGILFWIILFKLQLGQLITSGPTFIMFALSYISMCQNMKE